MPLGIDFVQILLHLFNVIILFGGLYFLLYSPVVKFMKKREDYYKELDANADKMISIAKEKKAEYESKLSGAEAEIAEKKKAAMISMQEAREKQDQEAREEAEKIIRKAQAQAKEERRAILDGAREDIQKLIGTAVEKVSLGETQEENMDGFLEEMERSMADV